jgi:hypothetical protein
MFHDVTVIDVIDVDVADADAFDTAASAESRVRRRTDERFRSCRRRRRMRRMV